MYRMTAEEVKRVELVLEGLVIIRMDCRSEDEATARKRIYGQYWAYRRAYYGPEKTLELMTEALLSDKNPYKARTQSEYESSMEYIPDGYDIADDRYTVTDDINVDDIIAAMTRHEKALHEYLDACAHKRRKYSLRQAQAYSLKRLPHADIAALYGIQ